MALRNPSQETFLTPEELSARFKLSVATVYKLLAQEKLPYFRVGKCYRIPETALAAYILREGNLARFVPAAPAIPDAARHFIAAVEQLDPKERRSVVAVILFGSYARGDFGEHSDIDLLVIVRANTREIQRRVAELSSAAMEATDFEEFLSPLRMSLAHWRELKEERSPLFQQIEKEGVVLWPRGSGSPRDIAAAPARN
jgi:excisionase family DNA binding protein